jgi:hypothetical protein
MQQKQPLIYAKNQTKQNDSSNITIENTIINCEHKKCVKPTFVEFAWYDSKAF